VALPRAGAGADIRVSERRELRRTAAATKDGIMAIRVLIMAIRVLMMAIRVLIMAVRVLIVAMRVLIR
jgi:hypothetical protein